MRSTILIFMLCAGLSAFSQSLPFDFEESISTSDFVDFDGGVATVIDNPQKNGINTSNKVVQIVRNGGLIWSGSKIRLAENLNFDTNNSLQMKVYTTAPIGTVVKFKLEGDGATERDVLTTVSGEWETMVWDFTGEPQKFTDLVFMFDFGNIGDGSEASTFLFDDVEQLFGGIQIDLPVHFEGNMINYTMSDFGGNQSFLVDDPTIGGNKVIEVVKTDQAATWAGTTIGTVAGFKTIIPLTLTDSKMSVKVWSPEAGTPIRLKVEDSGDPTHTCETETNTTLDEGWEIITFDFVNQAPGTESLSVGLNKGWTFNMASIFFNFGTEGAEAGEKTYYFDDVKFGEQVLNSKEFEASQIEVFPNPSSGIWNVESNTDLIVDIKLYNTQGQLIKKIQVLNQNAVINGTGIQNGFYFAHISTEKGAKVVKLLKF